MRKIIIPFIIVSFGMGSVLAKAGDVTLSIALDEQASILSPRYKCSDGKEYLVRYVNSGSNNLALITLNDEELIFAGVISGSGARYQSGPYEWWSKGGDANLVSAIDESTKLSCKATPTH